MASRFDNILNKIQKDYNVEIDDAENICRVERIVTDSPGVNYVFGGGIPKGRIILLHGPYSSGKTSLSNFLCAQVQKYGGDKNKVLYMDFEYSWDPEFAASFNLKIKKDDGFYLLRPENGEDAFEIIRQFVESGEVGMVVIDSASTISSRSQNEDPNKPGFGPAAKVMANGLRYINPFLARNKCTLIIIGQERANIGSMYGPDFKASFAGTSPEFYSSITCRVTRTEDIKGKDELAGIVVKIRDIKNKVGTPKRESFINLYFDRGIDGDEEYGNFIVKLLCERKGAWYNNESWGMHVQGQNGVLEFLKEHPDIYETAKGLVNRALCSKKTLMGEDTSAAADYADSSAAPAVEEAWEAYVEE